MQGDKPGMSDDREKPEALEIQKQANERRLEQLDELKNASKTERGVERGAEMAPHENETPAEEHRGGPLPNMKR